MCIKFHLILVLWCTLLRISLISGCRDEEKRALVSFKESMNDQHVLSNWNGSNCCKWRGVVCDGKSGYIIQLSIGNNLMKSSSLLPPLCSTYSTHLDHSLSTLKHLQHLDLSQICYNSTTKFPAFVSSFTSLTYLNLSHSNFAGTVPLSVANLTNLRYLDLSYLDHMRVDNLQWLYHFSYLKYLDLTWVNLTDATDWLLVFTRLPALLVLHLAGCGLQPFPSASSVPHTNISSISTLDLYDNFDSVDYKLDSLLNLSLTLTNLDLSYCNLYGPIPHWIGRLANLHELSLSYNNLKGSIPQSLGQLSELVELYLACNSLEGVVSGSLFSNMTKLKVLSLSQNSLAINMSSTWVLPFQLNKISLSSCRLGPQFPSWIQTQRDLFYIDISDSGISDSLPHWFLDVFSGVRYLDFSHNQIQGEVPMSFRSLNATFIDLGSNQFHGQLPRVSTTVRCLILNDNMFSGDLEPVIDEEMQGLKAIMLSANRLTGKIPSSVCQLKSLLILDLSQNNFSGEIPECRPNAISSLVVINLDSSNLSGSVPQWIGCLSMLQILSLDNNSLNGEFPSLRKCSRLVILDLGRNKFTGEVPTWIGRDLFSLRFLCLRANRMHGTIPLQLSGLTSLQVLDLSQNDLSGPIPKSFYGFSPRPKLNLRSKLNPKLYSIIAPRQVGYYDKGYNFPIFKTLEDKMNVMVKGRELEYTRTLNLVSVLDLSCNNFSGEISSELMNLAALQSLNLSRNQLTGNIPIKIGGMKSLETLDLSNNNIDGVIPESMASLTSLSHLDLSSNNLSGKIPSSNQFLTFTNTSYEGNPSLCGFPLSKACPSHGFFSSGGETTADDSNLFDVYLSMGVGYLVGLCGVHGMLLLKNSWRIAYFQFIDNMVDKISMTHY